MPAGRPTLLTPKHIKGVEEARRLGLTHEHSAGYIKVSITTYYLWRRRGKVEKGTIYAEFAQAIAYGSAKGAALGLARIQKAARGGDWKADAFVLERSHGYTTKRAESKPAAASTTNSRADRLARVRAATLRLKLTDEE